MFRLRRAGAPRREQQLQPKESPGMTARRAIIGLCAMCALLVSAIGAQGARALGTTAYTCKPGAGEHNTNVDCTRGSTGTSGHEAIPVNTKTELSGKGGVAVLKTTIAGAEIEVTAQTVTPSGPATMENSITEG